MKTEAMKALSTIMQALAEAEDSGAYRREVCNEVLAHLAGAGFPTPVETYGMDVSWAVKDLIRHVKELDKEWRKSHDASVTEWEGECNKLRDELSKLREGSKGWRFPKRGDSVRIVAIRTMEEFKDNYGLSPESVLVSDKALLPFTVKVDALTAWYTARDGGTSVCTPCVAVIVNEFTKYYPLELTEPA